MNILECNCSWHFAKQPEASQDVGPNDAAAEHFTATPLHTLEQIQSVEMAKFSQLNDTIMTKSP